MHRGGHAVEHLQLVAVVGDAALAPGHDRVGERPEVVAAEAGPHVAVVVVQQSHAPLVVGLGLIDVLVHGDRPPLGLGDDGLGVPVGALDQANGDGPAPLRREGDEVGQVVAGVLEVGLDHGARLQLGELVLTDEIAEQLEGDVLGVVVLHVEVDVGAAVARPPQDRAQPGLGVGQRVLPGQRVVEARQGRRLDTDVDPRQGAHVVAFEMVVRRPRRGGGDQCRQQLVDPPGVLVRLAVGDGLLPQEIDGEGAPRPPQALEPVDRFIRVGADDELARHAGDVAARQRRSGRLAKGDMVSDVEAEVEGARHVGFGEVLVEMAQHVGVARRRREHVDEAEQLGLERRVRHRPLEHALAPPRALHDVGPLPRAEVGDAVSEGAHLGFEGRPHRPRVRPR